MISQQAELDAVNEILSSTGDTPVNTLENLTDVNAINARSILTRVNRQFQSRGWSFNYMESYTFNPDVYSKKILWNNDILYLEGTDKTKYIKKDEYIYDKTNSTNIFRSAITADVIFLVPIEELPEQAMDYVVAKSCTEFATRFLGDTDLIKILMNAEREAWSFFHEYEMDNNNYNMLENTDVQAVKG